MEEKMDAYFLNGQISRRKYEIIVERNVKVPMRDGINLNVHIFRPHSEERFPALVGIAPTNLDVQDLHIWPSAARSSRINGTPTVVIESPPKDFFVRRGYVIVIGSSRGTGRSEGVYQYASPQEVRDIYDLIEWTALQPWCTGNIGMAGIAEYAALEPQVAALQPPHLKAIAPLFSWWDDYRYFWWNGGILASGFLKWANNLINKDIHTDRSVLLDEVGEEKFKEMIAMAMENEDIKADLELMEILKNPFYPGHAAIIDILLHSEICPFWEDRGAYIDFDKIKIPAYFGAANHRPGPLYHWSDLKMPKKLIYVPPAYLDRPFYQLSWELLRWFDYWLKGMETGIMQEPAVKIFVSGSNEWIITDNFPVSGTRWIPFFLHSNGFLSEIEPFPDTLSRSYEDGPDNRGHLKYYSAPLVENTEVIGLASLNVYASCRGVDMNIFASLWDYSPEGEEICLSKGYLKASHRELDPKRSKPWHPIHTHTSPKPLVPGRIYLLSIALSPIAHLFKAGHRIVLKISSSDDKPKTLFEVGMDHLCSQRMNTITIYSNATYPSHLLLPITKGNIIGTYASGGEIRLDHAEFMKLT